VLITRPHAIQDILNLFELPRYLEIGVDHGNTFLPLKAAKKVAVDPKFHFSCEDSSCDLGNIELHETTSDLYFESLISSDEIFDVIFLDGLHVMEQTLRDLLNAVIYLQPRGVIIIDDVIPNSYHSSLADTKDLVMVRQFLAKSDSRLTEDQAWMGDIYKMPFFIQTFMQQFSYATIAENHGQTVLWRKPRKPADIKSYSLEAIGRLEFRDFVKDIATLNIMPFTEIMTVIKESIGVG
jgi:hypothetical protein